MTINLSDLPASVRARLEAEHGPLPKPSKYGNVKVQTEYGLFDSNGERDYWLYLQARQVAGEITELDRQRRFKLFVDGRLICTYVADYVWRENGALVVADFKGYETRVSKIKRRLMLACLGITVKVVRAGEWEG